MPRGKGIRAGERMQASRPQQKDIRPTSEEWDAKVKDGDIPDEFFERARRILNDTELQNATYEPNSYLDYDDGPAETPDVLPSGRGAFGYSADNPIPVNGPQGEVVYLSRLVNSFGKRMIFHRIGTVLSAATENPVDEFELVATNGRHHVKLYLDMYHLGQSQKAPNQFTLLDELDGITGIAIGKAIDFPTGDDMQEKLFQTAMCFGAPVVAPAVQSYLVELGKVRQFLAVLDEEKIPYRAEEHRTGFVSVDISYNYPVLLNFYVEEGGVIEITCFDFYTLHKKARRPVLLELLNNINEEHRFGRYYLDNQQMVIVEQFVYANRVYSARDIFDILGALVDAIDNDVLPKLKDFEGKN